MKPRLLALTMCAVAFAGAAFLPVRHATGDAIYTIPKGTFVKRQAGENLEILPSRMQLVAGMSLVLKNLDDVPQIFGPTLIMPGQSFRLPFDEPAEYQFVCSAHLSGQMTIVVDEAPETVASRLRWRGRALRKQWLQVVQGSERSAPF